MRRWQAGEFDLIYSSALREEYAEKLVLLPRLERGVEFLTQLDKLGVLVNSPEVEAVITADPDDDMVLACAVAGQATHLVTYDPHIAALGDAFRGISIVAALRFLREVRGVQGDSAESQM